MAIKTVLPETCDPEQLRQALTTSTFECNYERSHYGVGIIIKEEEIRKLRFQILLLEGDNEDLYDQLEDEHEHSDKLAREADDAQLRIEDLDMQLVRATNELRLKARELDASRTELLSLENLSADSSKLLAEKLAFQRELSTLKPELEHLRSQLAANQNALSEKLALQRQLSTLEVELDNEKRTKQRLQDKSSKKSLDRRQDAEEHMTELEDLRKSLGEEKALHKDAKREIERLQQELQEEHNRAARLRSKANNADATSDIVDELRRDLARARRERDEAAERTTSAARQDSEQHETLKKDLAKERKEREKLERGMQKAQTEWEAQKELSDDKLNQFRTKLRATKDKLKAAEEEVEKLQAITANARAIQDFNGKPGPKNTRKREVDPDAALGTPGDGPQAKRGKRAQSIVGEKSSFSMTPFLKRQSNISITSPIQEQVEQDKGAENSSPFAAKGEAAKKSPAKTKVLALASAGKANTKAGSRSKAAMTTLEKVAEEEAPTTTVAPPVASEGAAAEQENQVSAATSATTTKVPLDKPIPKLKPSSGPAAKKPRKSIHLFASFAAEPEPEKKRKRKLGQGFGSTLFDEADEEDRPAKPIPGRGLFAGRALAAMGKSKRGNALITAPDGFQFSPLKKERRANSVAPSFLAA